MLAVTDLAWYVRNTTHFPRPTTHSHISCSNIPTPQPLPGLSTIIIVPLDHAAQGLVPERFDPDALEEAYDARSCTSFNRGPWFSLQYEYESDISSPADEFIVESVIKD